MTFYFIDIVRQLMRADVPIKNFSLNNKTLLHWHTFFYEFYLRGVIVKLYFFVIYNHVLHGLQS